MLYVAIVKPELCSDMFHEWDVAHVLRSTSYTRGVYNVTMYTQNSTAVGYGQQKVSPFTTTVERRVDNCSAAGHVRDCDCDSLRCKSTCCADVSIRSTYVILKPLRTGPMLGGTTGCWTSSEFVRVSGVYRTGYSRR